MPGTGSRHRARGRKRSDIAPAPHRGTCRTGHGRARPMASTTDCLARAAVPGRPPQTSAERSGSPTFRTSHEGSYPPSPRVCAADRTTSLTMARLPLALIVVLGRLVYAGTRRDDGRQAGRPRAARAGEGRPALHHPAAQGPLLPGRGVRQRPPLPAPAAARRRLKQAVPPTLANATPT